MKQIAQVFVVLAIVGTITSSCTTRELGAGAVGAGAGYMVGQSQNDNDDD